MKQRRLVLTLILLAMTGALVALQATVTGQQTTTQDAVQQKNQYEKSMEYRLGRLGNRLDHLEAETSVMTEHAKRDMHRYLTDAEKKQKSALHWFEKERRESVTTWKKASAKLDKAADDFEQSLAKATAHLEK